MKYSEAMGFTSQGLSLEPGETVPRAWRPQSHVPRASGRGSHPCHLTCLQPRSGQAPCGTELQPPF